MIQHPILRRMLRSALVTGLAVASLTPSAHAEKATQSWLKRFNSSSPVSQGGEAVAFDARGNVAVTGFATDGQGRKNYYTAKYAANTGDLLWSVTFGGNATNPCVAHAITCDPSGNVIVTGAAPINTGTDSDMYTVKYDGRTGDVIWEIDYDVNGALEEGLLVTTDNSGNVYVAGSAVTSGQSENIYVVRYSSAALINKKPTVNWSRPPYNLSGKDVPTAMVIDPHGFLVVTGIATDSFGARYFLGRYSLSTGAPSFTEKVFPVVGVPSDNEASGVAVDSVGNIFVTGRAKNGSDYDILTVKFTTAGNVTWSHPYAAPGSNFTTPAGVVVDHAGNPIVAGTSVDGDNFAAKRFYVVKYPAANGAPIWEKFSSAPDDEDIARRVVIDGSDNVIVTGTSQQTLNHDDDYYTVSYNGGTGAVQWEQRFQGSRSGGGNDLPNGLDVDGLGNVAVTGTAFRNNPNGATGLTEMVTIKYQRLALLTGDPAPGAGVTNSHVPKSAILTSLGAAALTTNGGLAARASFKVGTTVFGGIVYSGEGPTFFPAIQKQPAPGIAGAKYASFLDPVVAPGGDLAFIAKVSGVPTAQEYALFSDVQGAGLTSVVQAGKSVPIAGFDPAILVKTIKTVSMQDGFLVVSLVLKGTGIDATNNVLIMGVTSSGNVQLLRTSQSIAVLGSTITSISALLPAPGSPDQGRWLSGTKLIARVVMASGVQAVVSASNTGSVNVLRKSGDTVTNLNGQWKSFGLPSVGHNVLNDFYAFSGKYLPGVGGVTDSSDGAVTYSSDGTTYLQIAREGENAPGTGATPAKYASFFDATTTPTGYLAFLATVKGSNITAANNKGLWAGGAGTPVLIRRTGDKALDALGFTTKAKYTALNAFVLPSGPSLCPLFTGRIAGPGVDSTNNSGLWGVGSDGFIRQILRTGDKFGALKVKSFVTLGNARGAFSAGRSYVSSGGSVALVTFTNGKKAIVPLSNP